jgi:hypothetical protein
MVNRKAGGVYQVPGIGCRNAQILAPCWCTPTKLCCRPVDHRFEETRWESFEAHVLVGIVGRNLHQVVRRAWVNLDEVIAASGLIHDLLDRAHVRFDSLRRIKLAEYRQQREAEVGVRPVILRFSYRSVSCAAPSPPSGLRKRRIIPRIARCGVEPKNRLGRYRWVVERTLSAQPLPAPEDPLRAPG